MKSLIQRLGVNLGFLVFMAVFVIGMSVSTAYTIYRLRSDAIQHQLALAAIQAHAIEDHLTQSFNVVNQTLVNALPAGAGKSDLAQIGRQLEAALMISPALRSISLLDADRRIVASSSPANIGVEVESRNYLPPHSDENETSRIGTPWSGRDFGAGKPRSEASQSDDGHLGFIPVVRTFHREGNTLTLVAAVNPDYFINHYSARLPSVEGVVEILRFDGTVLLATDDRFQPGSRRQSQPFLAQMSEIESGHFEETLHGDTPVITAFRASRHFPLVVVTHIRRDHALEAWAAEVRRLLWTVVPALLAVVVLAFLLYVHLRRIEEQQAEARQRERDRLAATVFKTVDRGVMVTDENNRILAVNPAFTDITGYTEEEVRGQFPRMLSSDKHPPEFFAAMSRSLKEKHSWRGEIWNRHKNGMAYIAWLSISQVFNDTGRLTHFVATFSDITDRKQAEEAQLRAVIEASPEAVLLVAGDNTVIYANQVSETAFGYARAEFIGLEINQLVPHAARSRHAQYVNQFTLCPHSRPMASGIKLTALRKDGSEFPAEISLSPMKMGDQSVVIVTIGDITQRMIDEEALRASEERWKFALEGAGEGVWDWNIKSGETLFSKRTLEFWGYAEGEIEGRLEEWTRRIHPDDEQFVMSELKACLDGRNDAYAVEHRVLCKDNQWKWALVRGMVLGRDEDGTPLRMIGTYADITARKRVEIDLKAAKESAEALLRRAWMAERRIVDVSERTQERIGQELHDDLGQHLTGAAFLSEILFRKLEAANNPDRGDAAHITSLINTAVAKTRALAQGLYPVELKEAGLRSMIEQLSRNIEVTYDIRCTVQTDESFQVDNPGIAINLFRITQEAVSNAVKHGGARTIIIRLRHTPHSQVIEIADDGCGLGEPIASGAQPDKPGLGMHTMSYRASVIGATLDIATGVDGGVTVVIDLPLHEDDQPNQIQHS